MTWNIWFDKTNRRARTETLLDEIRTYDPDIVALQEVVEESLEIIFAKMQPTYYIIGVIPNSPPVAGYDTLILSKFPPIQWDRYYLPKTKMGRNLLLTTLQMPTQQITVGTFHLESVFFPKIKAAEELKESQLKYIYAISPINSILMGDTNLVQDQELPVFQSSEYPKFPNNPPIIDVYYSSLPLPLPLPHCESCVSPNDEPISIQITRPDARNLEILPFFKEAGARAGKSATYCGLTNKHVKNKSIQSRLDRIYVKIKRNSLKVHFYGLTGTFTQPSDHFGVFAQIEI
jgi:endonuclease/exonuclease/phosphatase family metal-dependent hydrolase